MCHAHLCHLFKAKSHTVGVKGEGEGPLVAWPPPVLLSHTRCLQPTLLPGAHRGGWG